MICAICGRKAVERKAGPWCPRCGALEAWQVIKVFFDNLLGWSVDSPIGLFTDLPDRESAMRLAKSLL